MRGVIYVQYIDSSMYVKQYIYRCILIDICIEALELYEHRCFYMFMDRYIDILYILYIEVYIQETGTKETHHTSIAGNK